MTAPRSAAIAALAAATAVIATVEFIAIGLLRRPRFLAHLLLSALLFTAIFTGYSYIAALLVRVRRLDGQLLAPALHW